MKFKISNLGSLKTGEIEVKDFTLICGKNNTGKTYINYAIYGFLTTWRSHLDFEIDEEIEQLFQTGILKLELSKYQDKFANAIAKFSQSYSALLPSVFSVDESCFKNCSFETKLDNFSPSYLESLGDYTSILSTPLHQQEFLKLSQSKEDGILEVTLLSSDANSQIDSLFRMVKEIVNKGLSFVFANHYFPNPFIITSERTGVNLFYKELDINKNMMIERLASQQGKETSIDFQSLFSEHLSRYAKPIKDETDFVRDLDTITQKKGELIKAHPEILTLLKNITGGDYLIDGYSIFFIYQRNEKIPLHFASSTVKSLLNLYVYLKHLAKVGDILIIDEPELNLHPENQRKLAKLFARLVNCGLKLLMTTHSDYLIKELNNLIVLSNEFDNKSALMEKYQYTEQDILDPARIKVYVTEDHTIKPAPITPLGIELESFDQEIINMTDFYDEVTINLDIAYD